MNFSKKRFNEIHEYANKLICIFEYQIKRQCQSLHLVSTLSNYDEHRLRYEQFTMCTVLIKFVLWVAMETVRFHVAQMSFEFFLEGIFFTHLVGPRKQFGTLETLSCAMQGRLN